MSREEEDLKEMLRDRDCRGEIDLDALAQLLADYEARIEALEKLHPKLQAERPKIDLDARPEVWR